MKLNTAEKLMIIGGGVLVAIGVYFYSKGSLPAYDSKDPNTKPPQTQDDVVPSTIRPDEQQGIKQMEEQQKAEVAQLNLTKPMKVGSTSNWKGETAEVWYYPENGKYAVVAPQNHNLDTQPKFSTLEDAMAYARGSMGVR